MREHIYFQNCGEQIQIDEILQYLNTKNDSEICFDQTDNIQAAKYALLVIGDKLINDISIVEKCKGILDRQMYIIILVKKKVFELYLENRKKVDSMNLLVYQIIRIFNESEDRRKWIYTYTSIEGVVNIVGKIILSEYFDVVFDKSAIEVRTGDYFQNELIFQNKGYIRLEGYYIDGFFTHKVGKHRPKLNAFIPIIETVYPHQKSRIVMDFQAPDIAGNFIFYAIIKKAGHILKMEDSIKSFTIHVRSIHDPKLYDAVLLEENPENGKLYTNKIDFEKTWKLKNISGRDWGKIIFKVKYEHLTHYFCKERKQIIEHVPNGAEFTVKAKFHPPDIPGKYTAFWHLFMEDGTEIRTDGPLCCSVVTQYETRSVFEMC